MSSIPTISQIRRDSLAAGNHFFTRSTMRFFGDTLKSFKVALLDDGTVLVHRRRGVVGKRSAWEYNPQTHQLRYFGEF